jgi:hypothetical protein
MKAFILFLLGAATFVFALLRKVAGQTAALDAAERQRAQAEEALKLKAQSLAAAEKNAEAVKESVSARLAKLEDEVAEEKQRDSVDVANDIIGRN